MDTNIVALTAARRGTHSSLTPSRTSRSRTPSTRRSSPRSLLPSDIFRVVRSGGSLIRPSGSWRTGRT
ncbi:hypothetical protein ZWY2020_048061 [Hordeum vulgare]|nr:hypothetical protein ZWY2020_048061 [Hordeum vulgare]